MAISSPPVVLLTESQSDVAGKGKEGPDAGESRATAGRKERSRPERLPADGKRAFHERAPAREFPRQAAHLEGRDPQGSARHTPAPSGRKPESPRPGRPRFLRDRSRDRAARARPPAQAD